MICRVSIWNVKNTCETNGWFRICVENGHRDPDGVVRSTIWDFHFRRLQSAEGDRRECCVATSNETSSNMVKDIQDPDYFVES